MMDKALMEQAVFKLTQDYGLYVGLLVVEGDYDPQELEPVRYIETTIDASEQPPYVVAYGFLLQFMDCDLVANTLNAYVWDDKVPAKKCVREGRDPLYMAGIQLRTVSGDGVDLIGSPEHVALFVSREFAESHLRENWMEDESVIMSNDEWQAELFPRDFRRMIYAMDHYQE